MSDLVGSKSIQEQYREHLFAKTSDKRLDYLIKYHHSLSIQFGGLSTFSRKAIDQLKRVEKEIEELLGIKEENE